MSEQITQNCFLKANARVINQQLKKLEMYGIIEKKIFAGTSPTFRILDYSDR